MGSGWSGDPDASDESRADSACRPRTLIASLCFVSQFHRHLQRILAAVCALCVGILLARAIGF